MNGRKTRQEPGGPGTSFIAADVNEKYENHRVTIEIADFPSSIFSMTICRSGQILWLSGILNYFSQCNIKGAIFGLDASTNWNTLYCHW